MNGDVRLIRSPLSVAGMVLTTISAVLFLIVFFADLFGLHTNPYIGIVFFLVLPSLFLLGLALIPLGAWVERRRRAAGKAAEAAWPRIDLNDPAQRGTAVLIFALTMANIVIVSLAAYRGVEYMDSVAFCGQVCHTVMQPEYVAHQHGSHANIACIECHTGPGATSFVSAKASGTRRVFDVLRGTYPRPIVPEPSQLPTAAETCEHCHSSARFSNAQKILRAVEYADDEKNAATTTTVKIDLSRVHTHMDKAIEFVATDKTRQTILSVRMTDGDGRVREFVAKGATPAQIAKGDRRRMDCMDCHNRPSHGVAATPEAAVNAAMQAGAIPLTLPFVHRESVKALKAGNPAALRNFFATGPRADVDRAVSAVQAIYQQNVFPAMKVTFGTYPNNIGHIDSPGCFRCHDDDHASSDGKKMGQDCDTCHAIE